MKELMRMIEVIRTLFKEREMLDEIFPVVLEERMYFIDVGDVIENAADLTEDCIEVHAKRLLEADSKNEGQKLIFARWMMRREVLREKPELAASLELEPLEDWKMSQKARTTLEKLEGQVLA